MSAIALGESIRYQTVCCIGEQLKKLNSPGSMVVPLRSPESVNGSGDTGTGLAKKSLSGGDATAARTGPKLTQPATASRHTRRDTLLSMGSPLLHGSSDRTTDRRVWFGF
jgi:hypothetical protein